MGGGACAPPIFAVSVPSRVNRRERIPPRPDCRNCPGGKAALARDIAARPARYAGVSSPRAAARPVLARPGRPPWADWRRLRAPALPTLGPAQKPVAFLRRGRRRDGCWGGGGGLRGLTGAVCGLRRGRHWDRLRCWRSWTDL